jgi:hypothetical protein
LGVLEYVGSNLELDGSQIESLGNLKRVEGSLLLVKCPIDNLGELEYVGTALDLRGTAIEDLGKLREVYYLDIRNTPLSNMTTEEEIRNNIIVDEIIM